MPSFGTRRRLHPRLLAIYTFTSVIFIPIGCSAFQNQMPGVFTSISTLGPFGIYSSASESEETSISFLLCDKDSFPPKESNDNSGIELWIDLRGTSLTPRAALELWNLEEHMNKAQQEELSGSNGVGWLPKVPFNKCLVSSVENSDAPFHQISSYEIDQKNNVLFVSESNDDDDMSSIFQQADPSSTTPTESVCIGRLLHLQSLSHMPNLPDPIPAMEVASIGQWIILDTDGWKRIDEQERLRMVLPLLELLSSSVTDGGGIGVTCHTNNEIVKAIMFIQCMTSGGGGNGRNVRTKTLESGIVVPQQDSMISSFSDDATESSLCRFAIVIPCDMGFLRTAKLMLSNNDSSAHLTRN